MNGLLECLKYSLPPNRLAYCGPRKTSELIEYRRMGLEDRGLVNSLSQFHTLYGYLSFIAYENNIANPFDTRVVKAYWIGNFLLRKFDPRRFYYHLRDRLNLRKKLTRQQLEKLFGKIPSGAMPYHGFHVLNVPWRTGHLPIEHTLYAMDSCRIGWGKVQEIKNEKLKVISLPLVYENGLLRLGEPIQREILNYIDKTKTGAVDVKVGNIVSFHWGVLCNKINRQEASSLEYYTQLAINLANEDIHSRKHFG